MPTPSQPDKPTPSQSSPSPAALTASTVPPALLETSAAPARTATPTPGRAGLPDAESNALLVAFHRFLDPAQALPEEQVRPMRADAQLVYQNVVLGVRAVLPYEQALRADLPSVDWNVLRELPQLALAVSFAAAQSSRRRRGTMPVLRRAERLRRLLLTAAEMLVLSGDILSRDVDKIRRGNGPLDTANDCLDLAALFRRHESARRRTVITDALLAETEAVGQQLLGRLTRGTEYAKALGLRAVEPTLSLRDRLFTLLGQRHRELRRVGMWLFMERVDEHVPALLSRAMRERQAAESAATPPAVLQAAPAPESAAVVTVGTAAPPEAEAEAPAPRRRSARTPAT